MGAYWLVANMATKEWIDPAKVRDGNKWGWMRIGSNTSARIHELIRIGAWTEQQVRDRDIVAVSDEGGCYTLTGIAPINWESLPRGGSVAYPNGPPSYDEAESGAFGQDVSLVDPERMVFRREPVDELDEFLLGKQIQEGDRNFQALAAVLEGEEDPYPPLPVEIFW